MTRARRRRAPSRARATPVVVDASVAVQWFANEPESERAADLIVEDRPLLAPDLMPLEAANAWWKKLRRSEMTLPDLEQAIVNLLAVGIRFHSSTSLLGRAARLAADIDHPVYDCVYVALALQEHATLATVDDRLRRAAARMTIEVWAP